MVAQRKNIEQHKRYLMLSGGEKIQLGLLPIGNCAIVLESR
jgi:hypothetical protein